MTADTNRRRRSAGLRAVLRLAARDARRDRWRSLLVLVVVALPVAGVVAATVLADSTTATAQENVTSLMGDADAVLWPWGEPPADADDLMATLPEVPAGTDVETSWTASASLLAGGQQRPIQVTDLDLRDDALGSDRLDLVAGEAPRAADEVAMSSELLARVGAGVGDVVRIDGLGDLTVVGEVRDPEMLSRVFALAAPGEVAGRLRDAEPTVLLSFPDGQVPDFGPAVSFGTDDGTTPEFIGRTRDQVLAERYGRSQRWSFVLIGGLAAVEVALVAGAAFAVSVRRRQRELGLLAATGGTTRDVRRSVLYTGVVVGAVGALVGLVLGVLAAQLLLPWAAGLSDRIASALRLDPLLLGVAAAVGGLAAVAGAWWPARNVARLPVLVALSGRRPAPTTARGGLLAGLVLAAGGGLVCVVSAGADLGSATPFMFLLGSVAVVLGAGLTSPWLLEQLGRTARFLPTGPRLAVRDAARFRSRNGPIVTAAMAGLAASVTITAILSSIDAQDRAAYEPPLPSHLLHVSADASPLTGDTASVADEVAAAADLDVVPLSMPDGEVVVAGTVGEDGDVTEWVHALVDDGTVAAVLGGDDRVSALLADGQAVGLRPDAPAAVEVWSLDETGAFDARTARLDVETVDVLGFAHDQLPDVLLPAGRVAATAPTSFLLFGDGPLDDATVDAAARAAERLGDGIYVTSEFTFLTEYGPINTGVMIAGGIGGLAIVAVAIALAAAEARSDLRILAAVGAGARTRRSLAAGRALLLAGLGGLLAVPVGLVPAAAMTTVIDGGIPLVVPWGTVAVVAVAVPLLACLGSVVASRRDPGRLTRAA